MDKAAKRFRELLDQPGPIVMPGTYDCVSAKVAERSGFPSAFISGAAVTASVLGYPDVGLQTMPEILNQSRNMARSVDIPLIVDVDTGYGNALNVMRTVREFEAAGLAGIFFEDQTFPKRCGHFEGKKVIPMEEMVVKVKAAREARRSSDFVIIARTDSRALYGIDDAIERALAYCDAGADIIFVEAMLTEEEMRKAAKAIPKPVQANLSEGGGKTPLIPVHELYDMGYKVISYSGVTQRTAIKAMLDVLSILKKEGTTESAYPSMICNLADRSELLGLAEFYELEEKLYGPLMETEKSWRKELDEKAAAEKEKKTGKLPI